MMQYSQQLKFRDSMPLSTACMQVGERTFHDALQSHENHEKDGCGMVNGARSSPAPETAACRHNVRLDKSFVGPRNPARQERSSTESVNSTGKYHSQQCSLFWACVIGALRGRCRNSSVHLPHCKAFVLLKLLYQAHAKHQHFQKFARGPGTSNGETTPTPHGRCLLQKRACTRTQLIKIQASSLARKLK